MSILGRFLHNCGTTRAAIAVGIFLSCCHGAAVAQYNSTIFGPNVYVFDPSVSGASINSTLDNISNTNVATAQFSTNRYAVLFKPGSYTGVNHEIGFYLSVAGLGATPDATSLSGGGLYIDVTDSNGNVTTNFWRSMENLLINVPSGGTERWAVSQGASLRRMHIAGALELTNSSCGFASGGFIGDTLVDGAVNACSQQQWYTRNSTMASFSDYVWNFVFSGDTFTSSAPGSAFPKNTILSTTPVVREKPYLYVDASGNYEVFSPSVKTSSSGTSWGAGSPNGGLGAGSSLAISTFYIATPSNSVSEINSALASGKNLILTPGIYQLSGQINVTRANTVVLGIGYPTLVPQDGSSAISVADVDGVQVADVLIDAGPTNSTVLMQAGSGHTGVRHNSNPSLIADVYFRIGGATAGSAITALQVDSDDTVLDNVWAWRADHGTGVGWTSNTSQHGLVVNGDYVTALGLAVEHFQQSQVQWNGNHGETIFYQSEDPYDVPSQSAWMEGTRNGYPSYEVTSAVCSHTGYGLGVYSYFDQGVAIYQDNAIYVPNVSGVDFTDMVTVKLNGSGGINNIIDDIGGPTASTGATPTDLTNFTGNGSCAASSGPVYIDAGSGGSAPYVADVDYTGGSDTTTTSTINTSGVINPAPMAVYQNGRAGATVTYAIPGFTVGSSHTVRLHFAETYFNAAAKRAFNVAINGTSVLSNFDIFATAGGKDVAVAESFTATADSNGKITIVFTRGTANQPLINGIEIQ